jgi:hypothetical protein
MLDERDPILCIGHAIVAEELHAPPRLENRRLPQARSRSIAPCE